jgi:hypothetical protein
MMKPSIGTSAYPYLLVFLYVGLPLGAVTSGLAASGFFVGALWSRCLEQHDQAARIWPKVKAWLRALVLLPVSVFGVFTVVRGLSNGEILVFRRYGPLASVSLSQEPVVYLIMLAVWCAMTAGCIYYHWKDLRRAHAT